MSNRTSNRRLKSTMSVAAAAAGLSTALAGQANAANLNENLVVNPSFEDVDTGVTLDFGSVTIQSGWVGIGAGTPGVDRAATSAAYAYSTGYSTAYGAEPFPAGAGDYFYTYGGTDVSGFQSIDVSTGDTAALIATGNAFYDLSAIFANFQTQGDYSTLTLTFTDGSNDLGSTILDPVSFINGGRLEWTELSDIGLIPIGTTALELQIDGVNGSGSTDGYVDLVNVTVSDVPEPGSLALLGLSGLLIARRRRG